MTQNVPTCLNQMLEKKFAGKYLKELGQIELERSKIA
jgi:hypothetical protein